MNPAASLARPGSVTAAGALAALAASALPLAILAVAA